MRWGAAVDPKRVGGVDLHLERRLALSLIRIDVSRVEASGRGLAWLVEGSLSDVVVARVEVEDEGIPGGGVGDVGDEGEFAIVSGHYVMGCAERGGKGDG